MFPNFFFSLNILSPTPRLYGYFQIKISYLSRSAPAATDRSEAWPWGATRLPRSGVATKSAGAAAKRSFPTSEVRGGGQEELPDSGGQGPSPRGATQPPRSSCCTGAEGWRGAPPHSRSGGPAVRRHPSSKVRSSSCALMEQPWRDTPPPR